MPFTALYAKKSLPNMASKFLLCLTKTFCISNLKFLQDFYLKKLFSINNSTTALVKRMLMNISGSSRKVTFDDWFDSILLSLDLLRDYRLTIVETIRKNKKKILPQFEKTSGPLQKRACLDFKKVTL